MNSSISIEFLENILNLKLDSNTIIFIFPGLGIGNIYSELSGCTLQTNEFEILAKNNTDIKIIGISNQKIPNCSKYIKYIQITQDQSKPFDTIKKENIAYLQRVTYIIKDNKIEVFKDNDTLKHIEFIQSEI